MDGRNGSQACTVIALCAAGSFLNGNFVVALPHHKPSKQSLDQLVEVMRQGNIIYDQKFPRGGPLLGVYDGLDLVAGLGIRRLAHGEIGVHTNDDLMEKLQAVWERAKRELEFYVHTPLSIMIGLSPSGHVVIFDSHIHEDHGTVLG